MTYQETRMINTTGRGFTYITKTAQEVVHKSQVAHGIFHAFIQHTSASLLITENADASVKVDLETIIHRLAPDADPAYTHTLEGPDDMSAHIRNMLTSTSLSVPIYKNQLALGTWQGLYLWEHRYQPQQRHIILTVV